MAILEIYFHNGRRTWGVNTPEVRKALEKQFGSKIKTIGGKTPPNPRAKKKAPAKTTPKRNLSRDRKFVSNEKHELAYIKAHPNSGRTGYKGVKKAKRGMHVVGTKDEYDQVIPKPKFKKGDRAVYDGYFGDQKPKTYTLPEPHWFAYMKEYSYKLPGQKEVVLEYELTPVDKANPGMLIAMEMAEKKKQEQEERKRKRQEFKDAHGGKEQWELDIPKEYQKYKTGGQTPGPLYKIKYGGSDEWDSGYSEDDIIELANDRYSEDEMSDGEGDFSNDFTGAKEYLETYEDKIEQIAKVGSKTPEVEYETKPIKGQAKSHKKNTHFAFHKPTKSMVFSWDYKGYEKDELYSYSGEDYFWTDVRDEVDYMVDKFKKSDYEIVERKNLAKKGYDLDDYKTFMGQKYDKAKHGKKTTSLYDTVAKKTKFVRKKGNIVTFKKEFFPRGTSEPGTNQILVTGVEKSRGSVKLLGRAYDTPWYKSMDELLKAVDWKQMESWHRAKRGKKTSTTEFIVMNQTDGITATPDSFKKRTDAEKFVKDFPKRYEAQGYYRNNKWEKMDPTDVELEIIEIDPEKAKFGTGGIILAGIVGAYVGYKIGRAKPQKKGFDTEKKYAEKIKRKAGETAQAYKERKQQKQNK